MELSRGYQHDDVVPARESELRVRNERISKPAGRGYPVPASAEQKCLNADLPDVQRKAGHD